MHYKKDSEQVINDLNSNLTGLSTKEANLRLKKYGYNQIKEKPAVPIWKLFLNNFKDPLVIILLLAASIQIFLGEMLESLIIFLVLAINSILGIVQTKKAEGSLDSLKKLSVPDAKVIRDNKKLTIPSTDLVIGDIVLLEAGDYVPADGRIIECETLKIVESMLTGESEPVLKNNETIEKESSLADMKNMVFSNSLVVYGRAKYIVTSCGMNTEIGKIANLLNNTKNKLTPLQEKLDDFGKKLGIGIVFLAGLIFLIEIYRGADIINSFMFAIAIAVAAIPEALSSIVTIVLATGTNIMAKKQAVIRKLPSVETLGSTNVICTDKTGTLTQNKMTVVDIYLYNLKNKTELNNSIDNSINNPDDNSNTSTADNSINNPIDNLIDNTTNSSIDNTTEDFTENPTDNSIDNYEIAITESLFSKKYLNLSSILCNDSDINEEGVEIGDPTEIALIDYAEKSNLDFRYIRNKYPRISELPFDSDRKLMSTVNSVDGMYVMFTKGAPDIVFDRCKYFLNEDDEVSEISDDIIENYKKVNEEFSNKALRVLAFAYKDIDSNLPSQNLDISFEDESDLVLIGLMAMIDPPRKEVYHAIQNSKNSGIKTIMITGDHKTTATAIAKDLSIMEDGDIAVDSQELDLLSDDELDKKLEHISVYARVSPENKIRIVKAWQKKNKITAMTGDGVNDAPALKQANIGISMGSGTEVAKDASSMVLLDDNFTTIINAIEVGRTVYNNIKKSITYLFSGNLGGIIAILFAVFAGWSNPFTTIQLLFINLVTDSLPAISLGFEKSEKDIMNKPPRNPDESILSKDTLYSIFKRGSIIGTATIIAQFIGMQTSNELGTAMAFSTLTLSRILQTFAARSESETILSLGITSNKYALGAVIVCLGVFSLTLLPFMSIIFSIPNTFELINLGMCFGLAVLAVIIMDAIKLLKI